MKHKKDWILIGSFLGIALIAASVLHFFTAQGTQVVAMVDGQEVGRWSLADSVDEVIETESGKIVWLLREARRPLWRQTVPMESV